MQLTKYQLIIQNINYYALLLFVFWLPLKDNFLPTIMAIWIFTWLLEVNFKERFAKFNHKILYAALFFYLILTIISILRANNINEGTFSIQQKLSLFVYPIILLGSNSLVKKNAKTILLVFVLGNFIASLYCLAIAFINSIVIENGSYVFHYYFDTYNPNYSFWDLVNLRYCNFSSSYLSVLMHPSYFSMYLIFSIIIVYFFRMNFIKEKWSKLIFYLLIFFFIFMLYLLQSRAGIISLVLIFILIPLIEIQKKLKKRYFIIIISTISIFAFFILPNSLINKNLIEIKKASTNSDEFSLKDSDIRMQLWYTSLQVIKENFWFGTSPANLTEKLVVKYNELGFKDAANEELNSHNQFLETFAGLGIFGFLSLIVILIYGFVIAIKEHNYLLFFLLFILSINFLFESMLNRMAGILFMMFFMSLLVFADIPSFNSKNSKIL